MQCTSALRVVASASSCSACIKPSSASATGASPWESARTSAMLSRSCRLRLSACGTSAGAAASSAVMSPFVASDAAVSCWPGPSCKSSPIRRCSRSAVSRITRSRRTRSASRSARRAPSAAKAVDNPCTSSPPGIADRLLARPSPKSRTACIRRANRAAKPKCKAAHRQTQSSMMADAAH